MLIRIMIINRYKMDYKVLDEYPFYEIYPDGKIVRKERQSKNGTTLQRRELCPTKAKNGYRTVRLYNKDGVMKQFYLHRLVWQAFNGEIPKGYEIDHVNGLRSGKDSNGVDANSLSNLRAVSHKENCANEVSRERYRIANAMDKGKYHDKEMHQAMRKEHYQQLKIKYMMLKKEYDKVGTLLVIQKLHCGYPRAKKLMAEMDGREYINQ